MNLGKKVKRTALVTGGSGFVGGRLIRKLVQEGWEVRALARSPASSAAVTQLGATPVAGELNNAAALKEGMRGCDTVFHVAAHFRLWGDKQLFDLINIGGVNTILSAAADTPSVNRIVYISAAAVVLGDPIPRENIEECLPLQIRSFAPYSSSKAEAERLLLEANQQRPGLETIALRPPMIWGAGMPMLDQIIDTVKAGQWQWVDGGKQLMSTCHVDNLVSAIILAAVKGHGGEAYFVADDHIGTLKSFIGGLVATRGVRVPDKSVSFRTAWIIAGIMTATWKLLRLKPPPPITRQMLQLIGKTLTLKTDKARRELGYQPVISWDEGIREMMQAEKTSEG